MINLHMPNQMDFTSDLPEQQPIALFDLSQDPMATRDLSAEHPDRMARLGGALLRWLESAPAAYSERNDLTESSASMLNALGYATSGEEQADVVNLERVRKHIEPWLGE